MSFDDHQVELLLNKAKEALRNAYAPYSNYKVGAAVLAGDDMAYSGSNVENAAFGDSVCAEQVAITKAVSAGARSIKALAVVDELDGYITPCGSCRQMLSEFGPDCVVIAGGTEKRFIKTLKDLLPHAFELNKPLVSEDRESPLPGTRKLR